MLVVNLLDGVDDVEELLYGGGNNLGIAFQCATEVVGRAVVVHHFDKSRFVVNLTNGILQLAVDDNAVGDNDDVVEYLLILQVVQRSEPVCQPGYGLGLARTCRMLD